MAYATPSDVEARWGRAPTPEELVVIDVRLEDVERMILRRVPTLDALVAAGTIDSDDVIQVEADAVLRLVRNPEGYQSETDGNYTYMFQSGMTAGRLEILPEEWLKLGIRQTGMFVIVPTAVPAT